MRDAFTDKIVQQMRDLVLGRDVAPTIAEAAAHDGAWLVHFVELHNVGVVSINASGMVRCDGCVWRLAEFTEANPDALWRPINAERHFVAWPEVTP